MIIDTNYSNTEKNVDFKAIYATDPVYSSTLESLINLTGTNRGKKCRTMVKSYLGDLFKTYESLIFMKGISISNMYEASADIFLNKSEQKIVRNYAKRIIKANQDKNNEEALNIRLLLIEELKNIIKKAKPVSTKKIKSNLASYEETLKKAKAKVAKNLID